MANYQNLLIGIGASAGGLAPLQSLLRELPSDLNATIIVATHRATNRRSQLAEILQESSRLLVSAPVDGEALTCAKVYVGQPRESVCVEGKVFDINVDDASLRKTKRIDDLFISIANAAASNAVGIILSGMLSDGTTGLAAIAAAGGVCIVQSPHDAKFTSMPESAAAQTPCDFVGNAAEIGKYLVQLAKAHGMS